MLSSPISRTAPVMGDCLRQQHFCTMQWLLCLYPNRSPVNSRDYWTRLRRRFPYLGAVAQTPTK